MTCSLDTSVMAALQPGMLQQRGTIKHHTMSHVIEVHAQQQQARWEG